MATTKERPYQEHAEKILERLVTLSRKRQKAKAQRDNLFEERDQIRGEITELGKEDGDEFNALTARHFKVVEKIERLKIDIGFYADQMDEAINGAEQGEFDFLEAPLKPDPTLYDKLTPKKTDEQKEAHDPHQQTLPMPNPATGEGVAEHMKAAITELELDKKDEKRLIDAGFHTIGALAAFVDDERNHLGEKLECGEGITSRILRALKAFRKAQVKAELAKERGE